MKPHTPGPWEMWTSNSFRRIRSRDGRGVCEPITQNDGHPDLHFANGGFEGPDALLLCAAPDMLDALRKAAAPLAWLSQREAQYEEAYRAVDAAIAKAVGLNLHAEGKVDG